MGYRQWESDWRSFFCEWTEETWAVITQELKSKGFLFLFVVVVVL